MTPDILLQHALRPDWPAPAHVHALVTTRLGGYSQAPYDSLNLGDHVEDEPQAVAANRDLLEQALQQLAPASSPLAPQWLKQVHGVRVVTPPAEPTQRRVWIPEADAATTTQAGVPVTVMTADCLPAFFTDRAGTRVAVAHAGWRGLCDGVLEAAAAEFPVPGEVLVWLGPAIGPQAFEVGSEVRAEFMARDPAAEQAFRAVPGKPGHWLGDLYLLARQRLQRIGINAVHGGGRCTFSEPSQFYSFRRDGRTGRMVSVIWIGQETA